MIVPTLRLLHEYERPGTFLGKSGDPTAFSKTAGYRKIKTGGATAFYEKKGGYRFFFHTAFSKTGAAAYRFFQFSLNN